MGGAALILLDTHVWVWYAGPSPRLSPAHRQFIGAQLGSGLGVSVFSCWEVALLVARGRLAFPRPIDEWIELALAYPGVQLVDLTPRIAIESTRLPGDFHRDPADQIIVATARVFDCELVTEDQRILDYPHVKTVGPR